MVESISIYHYLDANYNVVITRKVSGVLRIRGYHNVSIDSMDRLISVMGNRHWFGYPRELQPTIFGVQFTPTR